MTGDKKYPERAWTEFEAVFDFKDWNPQHYLDCAEMMFGVAVGYDWMYDAFTEEQHKLIEAALVKFGLNNTRDAYYGRLLTGGIAGPSASFVTDKTNFNVVDNGGSVCAALAIADAEPELCFDIVSKAIRSLEYVLPQF